MFLSFIGTDVVSARKSMRETLLRMEKDAKGASLVKFDDENFSIEEASEALCGGNLFSSQNIIVFEDILSTPSGEEFYLKHDLATPHIVLIHEVAPKKTVLTRLEQLGEVKSFMLAKEEKKQDFSAFAIADAVMKRDRKSAWVEFEKSRRRGDAMESVHGMIFWAFKTLTAVATFKKEDVIASGVKAYTYSQGLAGTKKYNLKDITTRIDDLKNMYHEAHRGEKDLEYSLEQFLLKL